MPSKYQRKPGSRRYIDYTEAELQECLNVVKSKVMTQRDAAATYRIPWSTIKNKLKNKFQNKPGRPKIFTDQEESSFVAHITALSEFGFPLTDFDLKMTIRDYLLTQGRNVPEFKNGNIPGKDWLRSFLNRHRELSRRMANNIKRVRAQVSETEIIQFIENLSVELENVPAENIYNYDETNLSDDPGRKTVICRRGTKYSEAIINATKVNYTVMLCGNAAGDELPPYIIYKSEHLWSTWTSNGPKNAKYNRTRSGWIDALTFEDWFMKHLIPILKKKEGRKVVIGDNLSSHINPRVLSECKKQNITFICLPPNATHILQPLDIAYFRPLKCKWRQVLQTWKNSQSGRILPTTPKDQFPGLLRQALESLTETKGNLIAGFRKAGIFPIDKDQPLSRLPRQDRIVNADLISESFMQNLKDNRANICPEKKMTRKKRLNIAPGKSICADDILDAGPSTLKAGKREGEIRNKRRKRQRSTSSTSCSDLDMSLASSTEDHIMDSDDEDDVPIANIQSKKIYEPERTSLQLQDEASLLKSSVEKSPSLLVASQIPSDFRLEPEAANNIEVEEHSDSKKCALIQDLSLIQSQESSKKAENAKDFVVDGDYVLVNWNSQKYPGQVTSTIHEEGALVSCMKRGKLFWRWPVYKDEQIYNWDDIICKINIPKFEKKGCFSIPELDG